MNRRRVMASYLSLAAAGVLGACTGRGQREETPAPSALAGTLQMSDRADPADEAVIRGELLPRFEAEHPGLRVEYLTITGTYDEKVIALYAAGTVPDLFWIPSTRFPEWAAKGLFQRLDALVKRDGAKIQVSDFFAPLLDGTRYAGQLYGLPYLGGLFVVMYNRRILRQAGVPFPADLAQQGKWTLDTFLDTARRTTRTDGDPAVFGTGYTLNFFESSPWLWGNGADWFNQNATTMTVDAATAVEALQYQADLIHKHRVAPKPADKVSLAGDHQRDFIAGKLASFTGYSTNSRNLLAAPDLEWDAAPVPKGTSRSLSMYNFNPLIITGPSHQAEAAWVFLSYMTGSFVAQRWTERGRIVATRKSAGERATFIDALPNGFRTIARAGASTSRAAPVVLAQDELTRALTPGLEAIARGQQNVADATREMKRLGDQVLNATVTPK